MSDAATPFHLFGKAWEMAAARAPAGADPAAVTLATCDRAGRPTARIVLLRAFDEDGFVFFTNYTSVKAQQLSANPYAALCFYWYWLDEQVRVEGSVLQSTQKESNDYFQSRPRGSQIGAWASAQSSVLGSREELEARYRDVDRQFGDGPIARPEFWGGYRLVPGRVEFWKAGEHRLHHRRVFRRSTGGWEEHLLYP